MCEIVLGGQLRRKLVAVVEWGRPKAQAVRALDVIPATHLPDTAAAA